VAPTVASVIDLVVHVELHSSGHRQVREIVSPTGVDGHGDVTSRALFSRRNGQLEKVSS
jgi:pilus assembly protein CpaF